MKIKFRAATLKKAAPVVVAALLLAGASRRRPGNRSKSGYKASKQENVLRWLSLVRSAVAKNPGATVPLVLGVMQIESGGDPNATNYDKSGKPYAQGLMQLIPSTQRWLGVTKPRDPKQSIDAGTWLLASLMNRYKGNVSYALAAYNQGPGHIDALYKQRAALVFQKKNKKGEWITVDVRPYVAKALASMAVYAPYR